MPDEPAIAYFWRMNSFNAHLKQIFLLAVIVLLAVLLIRHFYVFLPGVLGAITLYILSRSSFFYLTEKRRWKKGWTSLAFILAYTILIILPVYVAVVILIPKMVAIFNNPDQLLIAVKTFLQRIEETTGFQLFDTAHVQGALQRLAGIVPSLLTGTANFATNMALMFFVLYYMLLHGRYMENFLHSLLPLKPQNRVILGRETVMMIRANGIGIPLLAIIQGVIGMIGYFIFGIEQYGVWGFLTGVASVIPLVGTALVWVPLNVYLFAIGHTWQGIGLAIFCVAILTNVDYVARITVLRSIGDVHPLTTIIGVIVGLSMFGFLGLVFGPLLVSYFVVLIKIYRNEFASSPAVVPVPDPVEKPQE